MKTFFTPVRVVSLLVVLNVLLCLALSFLVFPALKDRLDSSYSTAFDEYNVLAKNLYEGKGFRSRTNEPSVIRGPGYPALMAVVYLVAGEEDFQAVQFLQALVSGLIVFLTFILARRLTGNAWLGVIAAALIAVHPILIWYTFRIVVDTLFLALCLTAYILIDMVLERPRYLLLVLLGVVLAAAAYIKSVPIVFPAVFFVALLFRKAGLLNAIKWTAVVVVTMVLLISPWTVRNYYVTGKIIPVHATLAAPIMEGYHAVVYWNQHPFSLANALEDGFWAMGSNVEKMGMGKVNFPPQTLRDEMLIEEAAVKFYKSYYLEHPLVFLEHSAKKFLMFWYIRKSTAASWVLLFASVFTLAFGAVGWMQFRKNPRKWMPLLYILLFVGIHTLLIGEARFQHTILPLLMTFAATGIGRVFFRLKPVYEHYMK